MTICFFSGLRIETVMEWMMEHHGKKGGMGIIKFYEACFCF